MKYNPEVHHRKNIRLKEYDYSKEGIYYITICTQNRECILGNVGAGLVPAQIEKICYNNIVKKTYFGKVVEKMYLKMEYTYDNIKLHDYIIMPNHLHGIIEIYDMSFRAGTRPAPTIADVIRDFKSLTTIEYIKGVKDGRYKPFDKRVWQRNYYEHIIRNEKELYKIIEYIKNNPLNWLNDPNYIKKE